MNIAYNPAPAELAELLARPTNDHARLREQVQYILNSVRDEGDAALYRFTADFDRVSLSSLTLGNGARAAAEAAVSHELKTAIQHAAGNIRHFHEAQRTEPEEVTTQPGVRCWRRLTPIETVGLYVPGGSAPLISTVLMLGVPAIIAGCRRVVLCSPPNADGELHPAILYAAQLLGIEEIYTLGGAQAIAAMAYGTASIPKVDKLFGPGNAYVTMAKQLAQQESIPIDLPAGPSEVMVVADADCPPAFIAADLLSQAEHGADSQVIFLTEAEGMVEAVRKELDQQLEALPRKSLAARALEHSAFIVVSRREELLPIINQYGPEHLILARHDAVELSQGVRHAGSVFLGYYTPESAGDYASGTNHTLPTGGYARMLGSLGTEDFMKWVTYQQITGDGLEQLGPTLETLAEAEGLEGHRAAVSLRRLHLRHQVPGEDV